MQTDQNMRVKESGAREVSEGRRNFWKNWFRSGIHRRPQSLPDSTCFAAFIPSLSMKTAANPLLAVYEIFKVHVSRNEIMQ